MLKSFENFISVNEEQKLNMPFISLTFWVLKLNKFKDFKDEHLQNI